MARLNYAKQALSDLQRLTEFLFDADPVAAAETVDLIIEAVQVLRNHPLVGRVVDAELRELVISRGRSGYLALYRYDPVYDVVFILTVRHQREAGYTSGDDPD